MSQSPQSPPSGSPGAVLAVARAATATARSAELAVFTAAVEWAAVHEVPAGEGDCFWVLRFPPDRRGIENEDRDAREAEEVRPGVP